MCEICSKLIDSFNKFKKVNNVLVFLLASLRNHDEGHILEIGPREIRMRGEVISLLFLLESSR